MDSTQIPVRHGPGRGTPADWTPAQRLKNHAVYLSVRAALQFADHLPRPVLFALGRACGAAAYRLLPQARATAQANLRRILPNQANRLQSRCFVRLGENLATTLLLRRPELRALSLVHLPHNAQELMNETLAEGRGAVFVSAHLGPFELVAAAFAELGCQPAVVVRESYDPRLDMVVDQHRLARGIEVIHRGRAGAAVRVLRALRTGRPVGFLPDLGGSVPSARTRFLGQDVCMPVGPQRIALRAGCPVLVGTLAPPPLGMSHSDRRPVTSQRFSLHLTRLLDRDESELGRRICDTLSDRIRTMPQHWLWMASRFGALQRDQA